MPNYSIAELGVVEGHMDGVPTCVAYNPCMLHTCENVWISIRWTRVALFSTEFEYVCTVICSNRWCYCIQPNIKHNKKWLPPRYLKDLRHLRLSSLRGSSLLHGAKSFLYLTHCVSGILQGFQVAWIICRRTSANSISRHSTLSLFQWRSLDYSSSLFMQREEMHLPMLALIGKGSSVRTLGQQVLVYVLKGSWGSWCSGSVLKFLWMITLC